MALVDADIGLRNLDVVMGLENRIVYDLVEVVEGKCILNYEPKKKLPIEDFLRPQGRFKHLFKPENENLLVQYQEEVDRRWENLLYMCSK